MDVLGFLTSRSVIVTVAIIGGLVALLGNYLLRDASNTPPRTAKLVLHSGYALSWASIVAFIVAGFLVD